MEVTGMKVHDESPVAKVGSRGIKLTMIKLD